MNSEVVVLHPFLYDISFHSYRFYLFDGVRPSCPSLTSLQMSVYRSLLPHRVWVLQWMVREWRVLEQLCYDGVVIRGANAPTCVQLHIIVHLLLQSPQADTSPNSALLSQLHTYSNVRQSWGLHKSIPLFHGPLQYTWPLIAVCQSLGSVCCDTCKSREKRAAHSCCIVH